MLIRMRMIHAIVVGLVLLSGCVTTRESYSILDLRSGKRVSLGKQSSFPEVIVGADEKTKTLRIFTRAQNQFEIRDVRYDGSLLRKIPAGTFSADLLRWYGLYTEMFAVSPNASRIAYFDLPSKELRLRSLNTGSEKTLLTDLVTNELAVALLRWRSDDELLVGVEDPKRSEALLLLLNVESKSVVFKLHPCEIEQNRNGLSRDGRYLVYWERCARSSPHGSYRIFDIQTQREVAIITARRWVVGKPHWSEGDKGIVYLDGRDLMEYSLADGESKCLRSYPESMWVYLFGCANNKVFFAVAPRGDNVEASPLYVYDIARLTETRLEGVKVNGKVIVSPDGHFLITGWGM